MRRGRIFRRAQSFSFEKKMGCKSCNGTGREIDQAALGESYRKMREKTGMSLRDMAKALGFTPPYVSDVERGRRAWSAKLEAAYRAALKQ